eukprot:TRINITY_DN37096_c0_g1_i2.p1 TRINITY_DN37096_c0_g1~~TRINITY_DN37096_c0_g1_i2.p1  ORF type:complete len:815 (+),score=204.20 TRINITY_DN37096_c0_g1_i2:62-2506(+)
MRSRRRCPPLAALAAAWALWGSAGGQQPSAGCGGETGALRGDLAYGGKKYPYLISTPAGYSPAAPVGVVVQLHGWAEHYDSEVQMDMHAVGTEQGLAVATLEGVTEGGKQTSWHAAGTAGGSGPPVCESRDGSYGELCYPSCGGCPGDAMGCWWTSCADSVAQVGAFLDYLEGALCLDLSRVYGSGCSNGGMMLYLLASDPRTARRFAAMAPVVGLPHAGYNDGPRAPPLPFIGLWGDADQTIPPGCGNGSAARCSGKGWWYATAKVVGAKWAAANGCSAGWDSYTPSREVPGWEGVCEQGADCAAAVVKCVFPDSHQCRRPTLAVAVDFLRRQRRPSPQWRVGALRFAGSELFPVGYEFTDAGGTSRVLQEVSGCAFEPGGGLLLLGDGGEVFTAEASMAALRNGSLGPGSVRLAHWMPLGAGGKDVDSEGIALAEPPGGDAVRVLYVSREGPAEVLRYATGSGDLLGRPFQVPEAVSAGAAPNGGFEALAASPDGAVLYAGVEQRLAGDSERVRRILRYRPAEGGPPSSALAYIAEAPPPGLGGGVGLTELRALPGGGLLALERYYAPEVGSLIQLFEVDPTAARNINGCGAVRQGAGSYDPGNFSVCYLGEGDAVRKRRLLQWNSTGLLLTGAAEPLDIAVDNYEGMCIVPQGEQGDGGDPSHVRLLLANDDNANPGQIGTQLVLLQLELRSGSWTAAPQARPSGHPTAAQPEATSSPAAAAVTGFPTRAAPVTRTPAAARSTAGPTAAPAAGGGSPRHPPAQATAIGLAVAGVVLVVCLGLLVVLRGLASGGRAGELGSAAQPFQGDTIV